MKTVAIVQARMGSTRLPGKVLMDLGGHPVLQWVVEGCRAAHQVDDTWIATSTLAADDAVAEFAAKQGASCWRGSESDVLQRVFDCAVAAEADVVVRITGDCPFIDPAVIDMVVMLLHRAGPDVAYAYNTDLSTSQWPDGLDVQVIRMAALGTARALATRESDRDGVCQFTQRNRHWFPAVNLPCPIPGIGYERWVLDTQADLEFCRKLVTVGGFEPFESFRPSYIDILAVLKDMDIRYANVVRNERFLDAMATEYVKCRSTINSCRILDDRANKVMPYAAGTYSKSWVAWGRDAPLFISHGDAGLVFDVDGNDYVDLTGGLGSVVIGYRDPKVDSAIRKQMDSLISSPMGTEIEVALCERLAKLLPGDNMVVLGKNGSDVCSAAVRIARAFTGRDKIVIARDGYHGWHDWALVDTNRRYGIPDDLHILRATEDGTIYSNSKEVAAIILEPDSETLPTTRKWCEENGILLIFDETMTGLRYPDLFAGKHFGATPDLTCIGKALGNGMPISALVGRKEIMQRFAPNDAPNAFYSGTFFGETLSIAAAHAVLEHLQGGHKLAETSYLLHSMAEEHAREYFTVSSPPINRLTFLSPDVANKFRYEMAQAGVLIYASNLAMLNHTSADLTRVEKAYATTCRKLANGTARGYDVPPSNIMRR